MHTYAGVSPAGGRPTFFPPERCKAASVAEPFEPSKHRMACKAFAIFAMHFFKFLVLVSRKEDLKVKGEASRGLSKTGDRTASFCGRATLPCAPSPSFPLLTPTPQPCPRATSLFPFFFILPAALRCTFSFTPASRVASDTSRRGNLSLNKTKAKPSP